MFPECFASREHKENMQTLENFASAYALRLVSLLFHACVLFLFVTPMAAQDRFQRRAWRPRGSVCQGWHRGRWQATLVHKF